MSSRRFVSEGLVTVAAAFIFFGLIAMAQAPGGLAAPKTPWGDPDLQGVWNFGSLTPLERPAEWAGKAELSEEEAKRFEEQQKIVQNRDLIDPDKGGVFYPPAKEGGVIPYNDFWYERGSTLSRRRTSLIVDPSNGRLPPRTPDGEKRAAAAAEENRRSQAGTPTADSAADRPLMERCLIWELQILPMRGYVYNNNVELVQGQGYVLIQSEQVHENRIVPLDGRPHIPASIGQWLGDARGRWEGSTLVVETTNVRPWWNQHQRSSGRMKLTERFTRTAPNVLEYRYTVDDPDNYTRPWTAVTPMALIDQPIYEYACHEGNTGMAGQLAGVRADEAKARRGSH